MGWAFTSEEEVLHQARLSAAITHDHPEGIKGAQATALAIYLARIRTDKATIRARVQADFGYELARTVDAIRPGYAFDVSCQGTVPEALIAFLDAESYEDTVRNAVSLGGDSDTLACIAGGIAEAFHGGVPEPIRAEVRARLTSGMWSRRLSGATDSMGRLGSRSSPGRRGDRPFHDHDHTFDSFWDGRPCPLKHRSQSTPRKRISTGS